MPSPALVIAVLSLFVAVGGGAYAASKAGKNTVVKKSIKNGAVTERKLKNGAVTTAKIGDNSVSLAKLAARSVDGDKILDGSVGAADLAPGTLSNGKSVQLAVYTDGPTAPDESESFAPSGTSAGNDSIYNVAPIKASIGDLHVATLPQGIGQAVQIQLETSTSIDGNAVPLISCTVQSSSSACSSSEFATIPAGNIFYFRSTTGPGGAAGGSIAVGYTLTPK